MESKKWYKSKTIWSSLVIVLISALTAVDQQFQTNLMNNQITSIVLSILGALGVYGRVTAKTEIK